MRRSTGWRGCSRPARIRSTSRGALIRFASEDIGNADPQALTITVAAKDAVHFIGMPEGNTALAQAAMYLATAPKSNAVYMAYGAAAEAAKTDVASPVPLHLRNAPTKLMKQLDYGKGYQYAHDEPDAVANMDCLPDNLKGREFYKPTDFGFEKEITEAAGLVEENVEAGLRSVLEAGTTDPPSKLTVIELFASRRARTNTRGPSRCPPSPRCTACHPVHS